MVRILGPYGPYTIQAGAASLGRSSMRKLFYAADRYWAFYALTSVFYYKSSTDGVIWSSATSLGSTENGEGCSIWFDGTYVHYARSDSDGSDLFYRRGVPNADSTITWSAAEQSVYSGAAHTSHWPCIAVDSNGYPWIADVVAIGAQSVRCRKSSANDGTWTTEFTKTLRSTPNTDWRVQLVPMEGGRMMAVYMYYGSASIYADKYTGAAWEGESTIGTANNYEFSCGANEDVVYACWQDASGDIQVNVYTEGSGWSGATELSDTAYTSADSCPAVCVDEDNDIVYVIWANNNNNLYYVKYESAAWSTVAIWLVTGIVISNEESFTVSAKLYGDKILVMLQSSSLIVWADSFDVSDAWGRFNYTKERLMDLIAASTADLTPKATHVVPDTKMKTVKVQSLPLATVRFSPAEIWDNAYGRLLLGNLPVGGDVLEGSMVIYTFTIHVHAKYYSGVLSIDRGKTVQDLADTIIDYLLEEADTQGDYGIADIYDITYRESEHHAWRVPRMIITGKILARRFDPFS